MSKKTVLLTGGAGFIGSHIAESYIEAGYKVVIADNLVSGKMCNLESIKDHENLVFYHCDITEKQELEKIFAAHKPDIINHHAAQKSIPASVEEPIYDLKNNLLGLLNLLTLCKLYPIKNFIYVSSGGALSKEITGDEKSKEADFPQLKSPYAITKFAGENYVRDYAGLYGFGFSVLRYGNVYGPRQIPDGECGVIPIFIGNVLEGKESVLMTFDDMPRGCTRDYVFIDDVVRFNMLVTEKTTGGVFNISSGEEVAMLDIYEKILQVFEKEVPIKVAGPRLGDIKRAVLDNSKAKTELGFVPAVSLKAGLQILRDFLKAQ